MALVHEFVVISKENVQRVISDDMNSVVISDIIIRYINDSLQWISSIWNDGKRKKGISYHGYSIIEGEEINKLKNLIMQWENLFRLSPSEIYLTGGFLLEKNQYEKNKIKRDCIIGELHSLVEICEEAIKRDANILHNGI